MPLARSAWPVAAADPYQRPEAPLPRVQRPRGGPVHSGAEIRCRGGAGAVMEGCSEWPAGQAGREGGTCRSELLMHYHNACSSRFHPQQVRSSPTVRPLGCMCSAVCLPCCSARPTAARPLLHLLLLRRACCRWRGHQPAANRWQRFSEARQRAAAHPPRPRRLHAALRGGSTTKAVRCWSQPYASRRLNPSVHSNAMSLFVALKSTRIALLV